MHIFYTSRGRKSKKVHFRHTLLPHANIFSGGPANMEKRDLNVILNTRRYASNSLPMVTRMVVARKARTHPRLCWSFKTDKVCKRKDCNFFHIRGTVFDKRVPEANTSIYDPQGLRRKNLRTSGWHTQPDLGQNNPRDYTPQRNIDNHLAVAHPNSNDFLEMKQQISAIQEQLKLLLGLKAQQQYSLPKQMGWGPQLVQS